MHSTQSFNNSTNNTAWANQPDGKPHSDETQGIGSLNGLEVTRESGKKHLSRVAADQRMPAKTSIKSRVIQSFKVAGSYIRGTITCITKNVANFTEKAGGYFSGSLALVALCPITAPLLVASAFLHDDDAARLLGKIFETGESVGKAAGYILGGIAGATAGLALTPAAGMIGIVRGAVSLKPASHSAKV